MKLNSCKLATAAAIASAFFYGVCTALLYWWPEQSLQYKAAVLHMRNLELFQPYIEITWKNFAVGLVQVLLSSFIYVYLLAWIYNWTTCCAHSGVCNCACNQEKGGACMCKCTHVGACDKNCGCRCTHSGPCKGH